MWPGMLSVDFQELNGEANNMAVKSPLSNTWQAIAKRGL